MCAGACNSVSSGLFVNSSIHSGRSRKPSSESRLPSLFSFLFWVSEGDPHHDVEDELLPELADKPETARGTKLSVLHTVVFPSLVNRGF